MNTIEVNAMPIHLTATPKILGVVHVLSMDRNGRAAEASLEDARCEDHVSALRHNALRPHEGFL